MLPYSLRHEQLGKLLLQVIPHTPKPFEVVEKGPVVLLKAAIWSLRGHASTSKGGQWQHRLDVCFRQGIAGAASVLTVVSVPLWSTCALQPRTTRKSCMSVNPYTVLLSCARPIPSTCQQENCMFRGIHWCIHQAVANGYKTAQAALIWAHYVCVGGKQEQEVRVCARQRTCCVWVL